MVTLQQQLRKATTRQPKQHWCRTKFLRGNPQKKAVVSRLGFSSPKKPNSGKRRYARARVTGRSMRLIAVKLRGPGSNGVAKFTAMIVQGHHARDMPAVRSRNVSGRAGVPPHFGRRRAHSKHGLRKRMLESLQAAASKHERSKKLCSFRLCLLP